MSSQSLPRERSREADLFTKDPIHEKVRSRSLLFNYKGDDADQLGLLRAILSLPWPTAEIHCMHNNTFMAIFPTFVEKAKCLSEQPWVIGGVVLTMDTLRATSPFCTLPVISAQTWVQIHGLQAEHTSNLTIWAVSAIFHSYHGHLQVPSFAQQKFGRVRIRVGVDTSKPLPPGCLLSFNGAEPYLLIFKYEKFPNICFDCGHLGHNNCGIRQGGDFATPYGPWMVGQTPIAEYTTAIGGASAKRLPICGFSGNCPQRMRTTAIFKDFIEEPELQKKWGFNNDDRLEMQTLVRNHVYYDPTQGWTLDGGLPKIDDNLLQSIFSYNTSPIDSGLIQLWEEKNNPPMDTKNNRLDHFRSLVQLQDKPDHEEVPLSMQFPSVMFKNKLNRHQQDKAAPVHQFMFKGFPTINVVDHASESEATSSSSSCEASLP